MSGSYHQYERRMYGGGAPGRITYAVQRILLITSAAFAIQLLLYLPLPDEGIGIPGGAVALWLSFCPPLFLKGALWQPFTYMLLHASLSHLVMNMLTLYWFGPDVERVLSTRQFFRFYIICGMGGVLAELLGWMVTGRVPIVAGASGATMGVLIAYAMAYPDREAFILPFPFPINIRMLVIAVVAVNLIYTLDAGSGIAGLTHFGGLGVGYTYMKLTPRLRIWFQAWKTKKKKVPPKEGLDALGEAIDNIFKFEDEKRRRR